MHYVYKCFFFCDYFLMKFTLKFWKLLEFLKMIAGLENKNQTGK